MNIRQVYVVDNQDWLAPKSDLTGAQTYQAILDLYRTVSDEQWRVACADLANAGLPVDEQHERYLALLRESRANSVGGPVDV